MSDLTEKVAARLKDELTGWHERCEHCRQLSALIAETLGIPMGEARMLYAAYIMENASRNYSDAQVRWSTMLAKHEEFIKPAIEEVQQHLDERKDWSP